MSLDAAKTAFDKILPTWLAQKDKIENEQETRFKVIDRILTEVLGWKHEDVKPEKSVTTGYIDYLLLADGRNRLVVEAKKASRILIDTRNVDVGYYKLSGPALKSAADGIAQAQRYCSDCGVMFAGLTTGFEWIAFLPIRSDGKPPSQSSAIVFPNLEAIEKHFALFYDLFSRESVLKELFRVRLAEVEGTQIRHAEKLSPILDRAEMKLLQKSKMAMDIDQLFKEFFSTMAGDTDPDMLAQCFVESKESKEADASLAKIARNLIKQIELIASARGNELQEHIKDAVETKKGEFVLIIGNKGSGKTTYLDRFFRLVLERALRDRCLLIKVDLADSAGDTDTISKWLTQQLKERLEEALFRRGVPTFDELQGVFFREYERWRDGEYKFLYESDKTQFKIKFGEFIAQVVDQHPDRYVRRLLYDAIKARQLMPCLVFDNTDHFSQPFQNQVFQFAQSIFRAVFSFVICPITDRTIWQLSKAGPLQSYETTSFFLPFASTGEVLRKRVNFIKDKLSAGRQKKGEYFVGKGIRLSVDHIQAFAACVEEIFVNTEYISRTVGWLANHDIRRSLQISLRIITAPIISIEELTKTYIAGHALDIHPSKIMQALIFGDYNQYNEETNDFVLNVFAVAADDLTTPLIRLSILKLLTDHEARAPNPEKSYLTVEEIINYFEPTGATRTSIKSHLNAFLSYRLLEPYDPTEQSIYEDQRLRITHCGRIHLEFALQHEPYLTHVGLASAVRSHQIIDDIREILNRDSKRSRADWLTIIRYFAEYCLDQDRIFFSCPYSAPYEGQRSVRVEFNNRWITKTATLAVRQDADPPAQAPDARLPHSGAV